MNNTALIFLANILSGLGMLAMFVSTRLKDKRQMLGIQSFNHGCSAVAGLLLRGYSGVVQDIVSLVRNLTVIFGRQTKVLNLIFVGTGLVLGLAFNNRGLVGLLPILASTEYAIVVVRPASTERTLKTAIVASTLCWAAYSLFLLNFVNMTANLITCASALLYLYQHRGR